MTAIASSVMFMLSMTFCPAASFAAGYELLSVPGRLSCGPKFRGVAACAGPGLRICLRSRARRPAMDMASSALSSPPCGARKAARSLILGWAKMSVMATCLWRSSLMRRWTRFLPTAENISPHDRSARFYGTGEKAHWPVQSNLNVAGACAVLADCMDPETESAAADALRETALAYFRYALRTHKAVQDLPTTDHGYWGCHWISVLGLERTAHAIRLLEPFLTDADRQMYDAVRRAEVNSILEDFEVSAGPNVTGHNHPESNTWNGCFLYRTLAEMPGLPDRDRILDKANRLLLAGISHPDDQHSNAIYQGLRESDAYVGANFSAAYGLDHHGYLNIGYAVITLSHIAMHYFGCKETDRPLPSALFHNARALWDVLRHFFFPDGRLLRIGGDTRTRYTYCQCYAIPVLLFAAEAFGDTDAPALEQGWLSLVKKEVDDTGDGSCYYSDDIIPEGNYIAAKTAKQTAIDHAGVPGTDIREYKCVLENDDGVILYEIEFKYKNYEYEYEINATDGTIIDSSREWDN